MSASSLISLPLQEDKASMLSYAFRVAMQLINNRHYREDLLRCLVDLYRDLDKPDFVQMCQCLIFLDDPAAVARVLENLSTVRHTWTSLSFSKLQPFHVPRVLRATL